ncbi:MAG TPA: STAS domain-containing protein [Acidimicrobiales bacterium]|jgi:anti-anti-sigma factor
MNLDDTFGVVVAHIGSRPLVCVSGEVDAATASTLREALLGLLAAGERDLVVDLSRVTSMDGSGFDALDHAFQAGAFISVTGAYGAVQQAVARLGLSASNDPAPAEPTFGVDLIRDGSSARVVLHGEIDLMAEDAVRSALDHAVSGSTDHLVVDLSKTTFLDSTGLRLLVDARRMAHARRINLTVIAGPPVVMRTIDLAGLNGWITFVRR